MDKITDKIAALGPDDCYFSLEFFPPKTAMGFANLRGRLDRMSRALHPLFVNVTWGAGGSTVQKSLELAEICQRELGLTTCLHLTCTNMSRDLIDKALEDAKALGIRNILALRGDPPRPTEYGDAKADTGGEGQEAAAEFSYAVDLVRYIRQKHGDYFCVGVAAYPEGHAEDNHPLGQSLDRDLEFLVGKVQAGADFLMTQLVFDIAAYEHFETTLRSHPSGVFASIPIIPGLMPIQNYQMIKRTTKLSHAHFPAALMSRLENVKKDDEKVKSVGVDVLSELVEQVKEIKARTQPGRPQGFHFYTLNLEKAVAFILERTHLIGPSTPTAEPSSAWGTAAAEVAVVDGPGESGSGSAAERAAAAAGGGGGAASLPIPSIRVAAATPQSAVDRLSQRHSSVSSDARNRVIVPGPSASHPDYEATALEASVPAEPVNSRATTLAISEGEGVLGREATWDDFPNGRWGDARSPAYGEIDGYGVSLHMSVSQAISLWGRPATEADVSQIFIRHLRGELSAIPWSEEEFNAETETIRDRLVSLNSKGWWTVASQPAVNGLPSTDAVFGWGPPYGFVFQKTFVEFFLPSADWAQLRSRLLAPGVRENICFYAASAAGDFETSDSTSRSSGSGEPDDGSLQKDVDEARDASTNAVTWGVFPGKEIVTPTIIEEVSFRAWSEEAFGIWREWAGVYPKGSATAKLLERIRDGYRLVNIIHHNYIDKDALWNLIIG